MNIESLESLWNTPVNQPATRQQQAALQKFAGRLNRERRRNKAWLVWTFTQLAALTAFAIWAATRPGKVDLSREWGAVLLLMVVWGAGAALLQVFRSSGNIEPGTELTIHDAVALAADKNRRARKTAGVLAAMYVAAEGALFLVANQLLDSGKLTVREMTSMLWLLGGVLMVGLVTVALWYYKRLVPKALHFAKLQLQFETQ